MIRVCDAIMGSGKTQSTITYFNEHSDEKFIYITPYLDEAARIRDGCPELDFIEPSNTLKKYNNRKRDHTAYLIQQGKNITTTHQAFKGYTEKMLSDIREQGYTLFIDENVDVLEMFDVKECDIGLLVDAGYILYEDGVYSINPDKPYDGTYLREPIEFFKNRDLFRVDFDGGKSTFFYWILPHDLLSAFKDVYILTYLFDGQSLHHFLKIYDMPYEHIGIQRDGDTYRFGDYPGYVPDYVHRMKDMMHIVNKRTLNKIGDPDYSLSMSWFHKNREGVEQLRRNVDNCIRNTWGGVPAAKKLWGSYNDAFDKIKGKGYTKSFLNFNVKATNEYRDKQYLIYLTNIFMNVSYKMFYEKNGIYVDEDEYALSIMVQWIWRSAIRDGQEIYLYIPSKRMRTILNDWIESLDEGGENVG